MYCRNCACKVDSFYVVCPECGAPMYSGGDYCQECSAKTESSDKKCGKCNSALTENMEQLGMIGKRSKRVAVMLGFILGFLGAHNFYLGYKKRGMIKLLLSVVLAVFFMPGVVAVLLWAVIEIMRISNTEKALDAYGHCLRN